MKIRVARKPPDAYQHGDLREALVDAGVKLLMEGGLDKLSLRGAAQLAGVSHAAPYRHYRDKDALVAAIAERGFRMLSAAMRAELEQSGARKAGRKLVALAIGYVTFGTAHPAYLQVIFGGAMNKQNVPATLMEAGDEAYHVLRDVVAAGLASGELRKADTDEVALACWSLVHGLSMLMIHGAVTRPETAELERTLTERLVLLLGRGIESV
jgi:AcrR family transcriptional regulator